MSYRPSLYPGSLLGPSSSSSSSLASPSAVSLLADKQREVEHFHDILTHSENMLQLYEQYADKYKVLVQGSDAVGDVVEHWQNVFRATGLALGSLQHQKSLASTPDTPPHLVQLAPSNLPDKVVRIPVKPSAPSQEVASSDSTST
ncbi:hypothetical protein JCM10212_005354 [Sporobolomyces blumeae]